MKSGIITIRKFDIIKN